MKTKTFTSLLSVFAMVFFLSLSINANAQKEKLQTAFLYQLTRLIEWCPEGKQGNFVIGVLGNDPALMAELKALTARRVGTQQIELKSFASANDITNANVVFVPNSQFGNIGAVASKTSGFCTLIVAEQSGAANKGAGVSIVYNERQSKLEFEINKGYMQTKSLNVSNQLYNLAATVY